MPKPKPIVDPDFKPGKPEVLDHVEIDFDHKDTEKKYPVGRPRGMPNKKTGTTKIFKEQMANHFEKVMAKDFKYILKNTVENINVFHCIVNHENCVLFYLFHLPLLKEEDQVHQ